MERFRFKFSFNGSDDTKTYKKKFLEEFWMGFVDRIFFEKGEGEIFTLSKKCWSRLKIEKKASADTFAGLRRVCCSLDTSCVSVFVEDLFVLTAGFSYNSPAFAIGSFARLDPNRQ